MLCVTEGHMGGGVRAKFPRELPNRNVMSARPTVMSGCLTSPDDLLDIGLPHKEHQNNSLDANKIDLALSPCSLNSRLPSL